MHKIGELILVDQWLKKNQQELVEMICNLKPIGRVALSSPAGFVRETALAASVGALKRARGRIRCLVVALEKETPRWQANLMEFADVDATVVTPKTYRRISDSRTKKTDLLSTLNYAITSYDFIAAAGRLEELRKASWDFVIFDEAQFLTDKGRVGKAARELWNDAGVKIAVAASQSLKGLACRFLRRKVKRVIWKKSAQVSAREVRHIVCRMRRPHFIQYVPSKALKSAVSAVKTIVKSSPRNLGTEEIKEAIRLFSHRLISSIYAGEQLLRFIYALDDVVDWDRGDRADRETYENAAIARALYSTPINRKAAQKIIAILENEKKDTKWECCYDLIKIRSIGTKEPGIIITEYTDTAEYIEYLAKQRGLETYLMTGKLTPEERKIILKEAGKGHSLLICTGDITELDLTRWKHMIHYDVPLSPEDLHRRYRAFQPFPRFALNVEHYFIIEGGKQQREDLLKMLEEADAIDDSWY
jgi:hypothetical protein